MKPLAARKRFLVIFLFFLSASGLTSCGKVDYHQPEERFVLVAANINLPYWQEAKAGLTDVRKASRFAFAPPVHAELKHSFRALLDGLPIWLKSLPPRPPRTLYDVVLQKHYLRICTVTRLCSFLPAAPRTVRVAVAIRP